MTNGVSQLVVAASVAVLAAFGASLGEGLGAALVATIFIVAVVEARLGALLLYVLWPLVGRLIRARLTRRKKQHLLARWLHPQLAVGVAVAVVEDPQKKTGTVVEEMLRGYKIGNKVIRHSMVKVVVAQQASQPASEPPPPLEKNEERPEDTATDEERGADLIERF